MLHARSQHRVEHSLYAPVRLTKAADAIRDGRRTCRAMVEHCLQRVEASEPDIHAYLHVDSEGARRAADERDRELAGGYRRGVLHGVPFAVKDIIDVAGLRTTAGSRVPTDGPARCDAAIVTALKKAGAIFLGKANTHEFAYGATTPPTRNPVDPERIAGGSSGGSAAAVAAGSAVIAIGTDTGGSVRLPAAMCGVAGWRPLGATAIGNDGIIPLAEEFDQWGVMAASAHDLELVRAALQASPPDETDRATRILVPASLHDCMPDVDGEVAEAFTAAVELLRANGAAIVPVSVPYLRLWAGPRMALQMAQVLRNHRERRWWPQRREFYGAETRLNLEAAESFRSDLAASRRELAELDARIDAILAGADVLALPTTPVIAPRAADIDAMRQEPGQRHPIIGLLARATLPLSRRDLTTLTLPCDWSRAGVAIGFQLAARSELALFDAAKRLEGALA